MLNISGYKSFSSPLTFQNHNNDLTIYCYKDSMAEKYAIKYNIKYVYLTKPSNQTSTPEDSKKPDAETSKVDTPKEEKNDTTVVSGKLPQTGEIIINISIVVFIIILIVSIIYYAKYKKFNDV